MGDGTCGECSSTNLTLCEVPYAVCDTSTATCVGCLSDEDCTDEDSPYCNTETHYCRECKTNDHCPAARPQCDETGSCVGCLTDADCSTSLPICAPSGACSQCTAERAELCTGSTPYCDEEEYACAACLTDEHCTGEGEYCDLDTKTCTTGEDVIDPNKRYGACVDRIATGSDPDKGHIGGLVALLVVALAAQRRRRVS